MVERFSWQHKEIMGQYKVVIEQIVNKDMTNMNGCPGALSMLPSVVSFPKRRIVDFQIQEGKGALKAYIVELKNGSRN